MNDSVRFIDCQICGTEHVDYLLCGRRPSEGGRAPKNRPRDSLFQTEAKRYFKDYAQKKKGFDFVGALAKRFERMYSLGKKSRP